jgi:hypothetical protein
MTQKTRLLTAISATAALVAITATPAAACPMHKTHSAEMSPYVSESQTAQASKSTVEERATSDAVTSVEAQGIPTSADVTDETIPEK